MRIFYFILPFLLVGCSTSEVEEEIFSDEVEVLTSTSEFEQELGSQLIWNFEDEFAANYEDTLKAWMLEIQEAVYFTLGDYPFDIHVYFHSSTGRGERVVTFGHTTRKNGESEIHLYVKEGSSHEDLLLDWTAQHEMSHLSAPFFGKSNKWLSEGFATYLSRRIMVDQGIFTEQEFDDMYSTKIAATKEFYFDTEKPFSEVSRQLFEDYNYSTVYWGGAGFFYTADKQLQEKHDMRFTDVVKEYQSCCRLKDKNMRNVISSWDAIVDDSIFTDLLDRYENESAASVMEVFN